MRILPLIALATLSLSLAWAESLYSPLYSTGYGTQPVSTPSTGYGQGYGSSSYDSRYNYEGYPGGTTPYADYPSAADQYGSDSLEATAPSRTSSAQAQVDAIDMERNELLQKQRMSEGDLDAQRKLYDFEDRSKANSRGVYQNYRFDL